MKHIALWSSTPQQGKSTVARFLETKHAYQTISLASPLLEMIETLLMHHGLSIEYIDFYCKEQKENEIPEIGRSYRFLARTLGTEWGRNLIGENTWTNAFKQKFERHSSRYSICVDDLRFPNELNLLRSLGFTIVKIIRDTGRDNAQDSHASDLGLRSYEGWDHVIENNASILELYSKIEDIIK